MNKPLFYVTFFLISYTGFSQAYEFHTIKDIEDLMKKVFINPNLNLDLLISHQNLWDELNKIEQPNE